MLKKKLKSIVQPKIQFIDCLEWKNDVGAVNISIESNGKVLESCEICEKVVMALGYYLIEVGTIEIKG